MCYVGEKYSMVEIFLTAVQRTIAMKHVIECLVRTGLSFRHPASYQGEVYWGEWPEKKCITVLTVYSKKHESTYNILSTINYL